MATIMVEFKPDAKRTISEIISGCIPRGVTIEGKPTGPSCSSQGAGIPNTVKLTVPDKVKDKCYAVLNMHKDVVNASFVEEVASRA